MMGLGTRLRIQRQAKGLSLREAADEIGVSFNTIARVERGLACMGPTADRLRAWLGDGPSNDAGWAEGFAAGVAAAQDALARLGDTAGTIKP
jgi:transcriptional regulator with XRE-family HTH domain